MENKICLINQTCGLGDILLCQKMAYFYIEKGYQVIWPVIKQYNYLNEYIGNEKLNFCDENENFRYKSFFNADKIIKTEKFVYLPINIADRYVAHPSMLYAKFIFTGIDCSDWKNFLTIKRNLTREKILENKIEFKNDIKFNLINNYYGTFPNFKKNLNIKPSNNNYNLYMKFYEWDRLFDWLGIFEKAEEIHVVDSSITLLLNKIKTNKVFIYERTDDSNIEYNQPNNDYIHKKLFNDDWLYFTR